VTTDTWQSTVGMAQRLDVACVSIRRWVKAGLPHVRTGRILRFREDEVVSWLKERERNRRAVIRASD
jgi:excisionase family DNA binding protein